MFRWIFRTFGPNWRLCGVLDVCCGHVAKWIKMPLGREVGLGPGHIVLHGYPAAPQKKGHSRHLIFGPCLLWPNDWMDQDATWYGGRPWPWPHCVRWGPNSPKKGHSSSPIFGPSIVAKWSPISATAEHLFSNQSTTGHNNVPLLKYQVMVTDNERYGDGAGNTVEENSSVFSLIRMR